MEPQPCPEPAEGNRIVHCTKTGAAAFGEEDGWRGVAALNTDDAEIEDKEVEVGAELWVSMNDFKTTK